MSVFLFTNKGKGQCVYMLGFTDLFTLWMLFNIDKFKQIVILHHFLYGFITVSTQLLNVLHGNAPVINLFIKTHNINNGSIFALLSHRWILVQEAYVSLYSVFNTLCYSVTRKMYTGYCFFKNLF